jgi:beta-lactam-binding protein with PASTA domain
MVTWLLVALLYALPQRTPLCEAPQRCTTVPNVMGLSSVKEAEAKLADAALKCDVREVDTGGKFPDGQVIGQGPGPGVRVIVNYEVRITVAKAPPK